jgi:hypothetical protein
MEPEQHTFALASREGRGWGLLRGSVVLDSDAIAWANTDEKGRIAYSEIQRVFLWSDMPDGSAANWYCGLTAGDRRLNIGSIGGTDAGENEREYRLFVMRLHEKLRPRQQMIVFTTLPKFDRRRIPILLGWIALALLTLLMGGARWVPLDNAVLDATLATLFIAGLVAIARGAYRPTVYSPEAIPQNLLPPPS